VLVIEDESRDRCAREADFLEADGSASASPETERRLLIDALWGENPPPSAPKLLQIYVSQLRKDAATRCAGAGSRSGLRARARVVGRCNALSEKVCWAMAEGSRLWPFSGRPAVAAI
jgi:hypothetical protein